MRVIKSGFKLLLVVCLIFTLSNFSAILIGSVYAAVNPTFTVTTSSVLAGSNADTTFVFEEPLGTDIAANRIFRAPVGWSFAPGANFAQDAVLGTGTFSATFNNQTVSGSMVILNDLNTGDHNAHWKFIIGGSLILDSFLDGNSITGFTFNLITPSSLPLNTPASASFTLNGIVSGTPLTLPSTPGDYVWQADFVPPVGDTVTRSATVSVPGTNTPTGTDVNVQLSQGVSFQFSNVSTSGATTLTSTAIAPPQGTGQFQLTTDGLYYDFNTTATFS